MKRSLVYILVFLMFSLFSAELFAQPTKLKKPKKKDKDKKEEKQKDKKLTEKVNFFGMGYGNYNVSDNILEGRFGSPLPNINIMRVTIYPDKSYTNVPRFNLAWASKSGTDDVWIRMDISLGVAYVITKNIKQVYPFVGGGLYGALNFVTLFDDDIGRAGLGYDFFGGFVMPFKPFGIYGLFGWRSKNTLDFRGTDLEIGGTYFIVGIASKGIGILSKPLF